MGSGGSMPAGHRQCTIEITNNSSRYALCDVNVYLYCGFCALPLQQLIEASSSARAMFSKTGGAATGAVGVFTYDLYNKSNGQIDGRIAVMFSVPFNFNLYSNLYAVGFFEKGKACDYDLYTHMYYTTGNMFTRKAAGNGIVHKSGPISITASMTDSWQPTLKLEVKDK